MGKSKTDKLKRLTLNKETVRKLTEFELERVVGGMPPTATSDSGPTCGVCCSASIFTSCCA